MATMAGAEAQIVVRGMIRQVKPRLRGWLHAGMTPLARPASC